MIALLIIPGAFIGMSVTWVLYLALMNLDRNRSRLTTPAKVFAYPMLAVGYVVDVLFNWVFGTVMMLELPREFLFTARCERHMHDDTWAGTVARWMCKNFLDPFDPDGKHCR